MAYVKPTPSEFQSAYPAFAAVATPAIQAAIDEADAGTDGSWPDGDRLRGVMLMAAHLLTLGGQGTSSEAQFGAFKRLKIGSLELERAESGSDAAERGSLSSTSFGTRYLALVRRLFPPILAV
ncbi:DUF4054 domain-containing protein [Aureimonas psammosilenae]|uniref:DUF4054 domain-containing protein n=1 Tax=Aureimonas psammosilenae TaxID=2495496 RepID=UPI001260B06B|nr:DUF4054 domain-containing protein [Aureimonas psammosilenae]